MEWRKFTRSEMIKTIADNWKLWLIVSLTLGLAPFVPEPHLLGKLKWLFGGAVGMQARDWFDLLMHGSPWVLLLFSGLIKLFKWG